MSESVAQDLWNAWGSGRLCFQQCGACGNAQHPPGPVCSRCHSTTLSLGDVSGVVELVSWSTVLRPPSPRFADQIPYTVLVVMLREGALVELRLLDERAAEAADQWQVGMRGVLELGEVGGRVMPVVGPLGRKATR
jgi:uncharacterized OB-fold protein